MTTTTLRTLLCASLLSVAFAASARADLKPGAGWVTQADYDRALAAAKEQGRPVAILYAFKDSTCPLHHGMASSVMSNRGLAGMARVLVYTDDGNSQVTKNLVEKDGRAMLPQVFLLDPSGRLTAAVPYGQEERLGTEAARVMELATWQEKSKKQLAKADEAAEAGRYKAALAIVAKVAAEDAAATRAVDASLAATKEGKAAETKAGAAPKSSKSRPKTAKKGGPAAAGEPVPEGKYFPKLLASKREAYTKQADARLAEARKLAETDPTAARKLLTPMVTDGADFASVAEAAKLMDELKPGAKAKAK